MLIHVQKNEAEKRKKSREVVRNSGKERKKEEGAGGKDRKKEKGREVGRGVKDGVGRAM